MLLKEIVAMGDSDCPQVLQDREDQEEWHREGGTHPENNLIWLGNIERSEEDAFRRIYRRKFGEGVKLRIVEAAFDENGRQTLVNQVSAWGSR